MDAETLLTSFDRNGVLGELTSVDEAAQARLFAEAYQLAVKDLNAARQRAADSGRPIRIDASRLSGVNGSDTWIVEPAGAIRRELACFERVEQMLSAIPRTDEDRALAPDAVDLDAVRPLLARMAYNALWSPSGTNWQPIRAVELAAQDVARLTDGRHRVPGLAVLARVEYASILGDVASLCGLKHASHAEDIDLGIWLEVAHQTARAHGWAFAELDLDPAPTSALLTDRLGRRSAIAVRESLESGELRPARLLVPVRTTELLRDPTAPAGLAPTDLDRLVEARSTQRVASPARSLPPDALAGLWATALAAATRSPSAGTGGLALVRFTRDDETPACIGQAMQAGIEGPGGLASRIDLAQLCACLELPIERDEALPAESIPSHLRSKLISGGGYDLQSHRLVDRRGRVLTAGRLVRLVHLLTLSFGRFFLSFHNTHPLVGVLATRPEDSAYEQAGRCVAHMSLVARARGQVSIIKSGPIEIARDAISALIAPHLSDPGLTPLVTFQLGLPLGPDEPVSAGAQDEHAGLMERKLDRRAPRARLSDHYVPAPNSRRD